MNRIKELRVSRGLTQAELAKQLGTTQQTVGRWEAGKSAPSVSTLNSIAYALETTVGYLLGQRPVSEITMASAEPEEEEGWFWGHIGLLLPSAKKTLWFPISASTRSRVWSVLRNLDVDDNDKGWLVVETLNNRMLAFSPDRMDRIWLLDDGCDGPADDWTSNFPLDDYAGHPQEIYQAMDRLLDQAWGASEDNISNDLEPVREMINRAKLGDPEKLNRYLHYTNLHYLSGRVISYHVTPNDLWSAIMDVEMGFVRALYLPDYVAEDETFIPLKNLALFNAPMLDAIEGRDHDLEQFDKASSQ